MRNTLAFVLRILKLVNIEAVIDSCNHLSVGLWWLKSKQPMGKRLIDKLAVRHNRIGIEMALRQLRQFLAKI